MIILQIEVTDFSLLDSKSDPPVTRYGNTPRPGPVTRQLMNTPARWAANAVHIVSRNQDRQNIPYSIDEITPKAARIVILNETL
jgi:hypothetical protein